MAMHLAAHARARGVPRCSSASGWHPWKVLALASLIFCCSNLAQAQLPQPLVFSSGGAVALRNDQSGALTPTNGSPFAAAGQNLTLDVQGRFLFSIGENSIRMFQITDTGTGKYQEVPHSPFASANTKSPIFIAVEPTGKFIAVVDLVGLNPGESLVETFQIDATSSSAPALVPVPGSAAELVSTPVSGGVVQPPNVQKFLIYMGPNPFSSDTTIRAGEDFESVNIDPQSGNLLGIQNQPDNSTGRSFAMDPQGRFVVIGRGLHDGQIQLQSITPNFPSANFTIGQSLFPIQLYVDSTGAFLYVSYDPDPTNKVHIFAINPANGAMSETSSSPLPGTASVPLFNADPTGPFQYGGDFQPDLLHGFTVDPQTGYFVEIAGSPFTVPGAGVLTFSIPSGQQGVSGPSISLSTTSLSFSSMQTGSASQPQSVTLTSNGAGALSINSVVLGGPDAAEFLESDTCHPPNVLQPKNFCAASVTFKPMTPGPKQATLTITDDAPGSPHSVQIGGTAVAPPPPAPAVTIAPNPVNFPTITQGTISSPINIIVTNSGNATLHISTVTIGGNNPGDFSNPASGCSGAPIAPNSSCTISVTFAPLAAGQRTETISLADDASDSPQVINVAGNANPAMNIGATATGSTTAAVNAGATAQYQLQLTPGANYTGNVTFTCTGAPLGAACQAPALTIANGNVMPFTVSVTTSGAAHAQVLPLLPRGIFAAQLRMPPVLPLLVAMLGLLIAKKAFREMLAPRHRVLAGALATIICVSLFSASGCGGGSYQAPVTPPPPVTTPQGTSTLTITPSATNSAGKPLQLTPIQLTLTVN